MRVWIRDRINLALHWHILSVLDKKVDAFIKSWIALEALAMPSSNVRPINEKLSKIYNITYKDAVDRFKIGKIQGLRSDVLHNGKRNIDGNLLIYLEALFVDLLIDELSLENSRNPYPLKQKSIVAWRELAKIDIVESEEVLQCAEGFANIGLRSHDALHIACAIAAKCDWFITTDKDILRKSPVIDRIKVVNPVEFWELREEKNNEK